MWQPFVSCLCPTYRRPQLLANAVACFLNQDYPADRRELIILDDADQYAPSSGPGWELISLPRRYRSLPEKYNALAALARGDVLVVWEDDDIYLPPHISRHVAALQMGQFSKPSRILSLYTGQIAEEPASGRFHGSIAFTRELYDSINGWPITQRSDFDLCMMSRLSEASTLADTCDHGSPTYVFRWGSTGAYHGQAAMRGPQDEGWYERCANAGDDSRNVTLVPAFDRETQQVLDQIRRHPSDSNVNAEDVLPSTTQKQNPHVLVDQQQTALQPPLQIPVYITCYNVLSWPRRLAEQCRELGFKPILIDNASTYPPLLEWYESCPYEVMRLERNLGCYGFWQLPIATEQSGYYIVTDCDLDLTEVPKDVATRLIEVFERHPDVTKVGLSLEIEDLPDSYLLKESVRAHESQFWQHRVEPGVWRANVGATFALYHTSRNPQENFYNALRLDRPYTARHEPWYLHRGNSTDEHRYYFDRIETVTHWGNWMKGLLQPAVREDQFTPPRADCPHPEHWTATESQGPEREVLEFVHGWIRVLQPEECLAICQGHDEVPRIVGRALKDNGHGQQLVVTSQPSDEDMLRRLCTNTPTRVTLASLSECVPSHDVQFIWIGSVPVDSLLPLIEKFVHFCPGLMIFSGCAPGSVLRDRLSDFEQQNLLRILDVPTPRGLAIAESQARRPRSKRSGQWHDLAFHGGAGGREDLQIGWHELAANLFPGHDVLDVGAGLGGSRARLARTAARVRLQDPAPDLPVDLHIPISQLPDDDATAVTAFDVIEHIEDDGSFLMNLLRVTRTHVFLTTPNWFVSHAQNHCHVREYTPWQLESLCVSTRAHIRYWVGDPLGIAAKEVSRSDFLTSREPHLGILLTKTNGPTSEELATSTTDLESLYRRGVSEPGDINEHCPRLRELASQCRHVTDFGMRPNASTVALLAGRPDVLVSYHRPRYPQAELFASLVDPGCFRFIEGDSLSVEIEPTDLLFIDTLHTAAHLARELALHADHVRRWIVLHDTDIYGETGEDGSPGLLHAVRKFLQDHHDWSIQEQHTHQYGLMVLVRHLANESRSDSSSR